MAEIRTQPLVKKNFFRELMNSLDPRSPVLNRTPIVFDCLADEKSFNLDDTFADLFAVEKNQEQKLQNKHLKKLDDPRSPISTIPRTPIVCKHANPSEETKENTETEKKDLLVDPRSPTVEMARTPIFKDEEIEEVEDEVEQIQQPNIIPKPKLSKRLNKIRSKKIFNENYEILNTPPSKQPISKLATHANGARTPLGNINGNKMVLRSNRQQQV